MKKDKICTHENTLQVGTETTVEVWCTDCNEVIRVGKPFPYTVQVKSFNEAANQIAKTSKLFSRSGVYSKLKGRRI